MQSVLRRRKLQSGIMAIVTSKINRDKLQSKANRGNPQIATSVEPDFLYPPQRDILGVTTYAINADAQWLKLRRYNLFDFIEVNVTLCNEARNCREQGTS